MFYFKDTVGKVYGFDAMQVDAGYASEFTALTTIEVHQHLNPTPSAEQIANESRLWRDSELARADVELNKVQDGMGVGTVTQWRAYRVALRNWPTTDGWPESTKPVPPDYKE